MHASKEQKENVKKGIPQPVSKESGLKYMQVYMNMAGKTLLSIAFQTPEYSSSWVLKEKAPEAAYIDKKLD